MEVLTFCCQYFDFLLRAVSQHCELMQSTQIAPPPFLRIILIILILLHVYCPTQEQKTLWKVLKCARVRVVK